MEIFLIIASILFFIFGSLFLFAPKALTKIVEFANHVVFTFDKKALRWRIPIGMIFVVLAIVFLFVVLNKNLKF